MTSEDDRLAQGNGAHAWRRFVTAIRRSIVPQLSAKHRASDRNNPQTAEAPAAPPTDPGISSNSQAAGRKFQLLIVADDAHPRDAQWDCLALVCQMGEGFGIAVTVILLKGGPLEAAYRCLAPTHVIDGDAGKLASVAAALAAAGCRGAICDALAMETYAPLLLAAGFTAVAIAGHAPDIAATGNGERGNSGFRRFSFDLLRDVWPGLKAVSVVVPNFNYAHHIGQRLASIFAQTYPIFEVIVLDDASTDDSLARLTEIRGKSRRDFELLANDRNSGSVFRQWTKGGESAEGDLLWIAEADDLARPDFVERLASEFADPAVDMAFANSSQVDENSVLLADSYDFYYEKHVPGLLADVTLPGPEFLRRFLSVRNAIFNASAVIFRRGSLMLALAASAAEFGILRVAGDWNVYVEICRQGGVVTYLTRPLNVHRRHSASVTLSMDYWRHIAEIFHIHRKVMAVVGDSGIATAQGAYIDELVQQLSLVTLGDLSIPATASLKWLNELGGDPDILRQAVQNLPAAVLDELLRSMPPEYMSVRAAIERMYMRADTFNGLTQL